MFCNDWQLIIWEHVRARQYHDESWPASLLGGHDGNGRGLNISRYSDAKLAQDFLGDGNGRGLNISRYSDAKLAQDFLGKVLLYNYNN